MNRFAWLRGLLGRLEAAGVTAEPHPADTLAPARCFSVSPADWGTAAEAASGFGCRWVGVWGDPEPDHVTMRCCLCQDGDYVVLVARTRWEDAVLPSQTPHFPAADRMERHAQDLLGVTFENHPDGRRWTRHKAWDADDYPLRCDFPAVGRSTRRAPADADYPFGRVAGAGVYEIPVGPVHAGVIEPGHFRFQAVGETVLTLEERLGYVHKGIEKIAVGRDADGLARLAGRVSGDTTVAHTWSACMAMERAIGVRPPRRGLAIRAIFAERERVANHLGDIGAICNDVAFSFAHMQLGRLREWWQRENQRAFGHRLLMDCVVPGGAVDPAYADWAQALARQNALLADELDHLLPILEDYPSLEDRLEDTGTLGAERARSLGTVGYVGKASGIDYDVRRDHGYAPYDDLVVESPVLREGDVAARVQIRITEIRQSLALLGVLLQRLPSGPARAPWPELPSAGDGIGLVEGWRGEILTYVRFGDDGRVARFFPRDPSWFSWPALERLIDGNIVPDFPVCNKSVNGSYSGHDL